MGRKIFVLLCCLGALPGLANDSQLVFTDAKGEPVKIFPVLKDWSLQCEVDENHLRIEGTDAGQGWRIGVELDLTKKTTQVDASQDSLPVLTDPQNNHWELWRASTLDAPRGQCQVTAFDREHVEFTCLNVRLSAEKFVGYRHFKANLACPN